MRVDVAVLGEDSEWYPLRAVTPEDPPGSFSSHDESLGRQMLLFGWVDGQVGVWRSKGGVDVETGTTPQGPPGRLVHSVGLELLSGLAEPYDVAMVNPTYGKLVLRFTFVGD